MSDRSEFMAIGRAHHFAFVEVNQNKSALDGANHQRAKILIQHKYPIIHCRKIAGILVFNKYRLAVRAKINL